MFSYFLLLIGVGCSLKVLPGDFYNRVVFPVQFSASEGGKDSGGLPVSTGFGLLSFSPLAASHKLNSSSFVMSAGLMFSIGTTLTSETTSCH
ncbi:MAG TPA: hypothetical protein VFY06_07930 [Verrucomicrobiae bacterium]|jgi:hypothetical protein|nr:hypothetical protein [Verrucomicrobiae bacterium]